MEKYKVSFYFGVWSVNPFVKPSKEVLVEVEHGTTENEIVLKALNELNSYPRTYSTSIIKVN